MESILAAMKRAAFFTKETEDDRSKAGCSSGLSGKGEGARKGKAGEGGGELE